jgi:2-oxoisovalerate dehydrogenase E1 component beta subunit
MVAALNAALADALREDERVLVFGEDVGRSGGVFRVTDGLQAEFGERRVFDTPISEAGIAGAAVGLAFAGWRSVVEMQFDAFSYPSLEQVIDHVAKMRMRTRGRVDMPITIRMPAFGGIKGKEHHGESPETYYAHTAGLKVVAPSNPGDAYRMLRLAIADPDPVIVLEPKARYWVKADAELTSEGPGLAEAAVVREGDAASIFTYGAMVARSVEAASILADEGVEVRVVDLRSLAPLDVDTIARCVRETGRAVVVHEAPRTAGLGAEVTARIVEEAFDFLEAPVRRVTGYDVPYPPAAIEHHFLPSVQRIAAGVRAVVEYRWTTVCSRCRTWARVSRRVRSSSGSFERETTSS